MADKLFDDFLKTTDDEWLDKISSDLKGKSASDIAKSRPFENLKLKVFYSEKDRDKNAFLNIRSNWSIGEDEDYEVGLCSDPLNHLVQNGDFPKNSDKNFKDFAGEIIQGNKFIGVDGAIYQAAGASAITELACIASHLNEYLNKVRECDLDSKKIAGLRIKVGIGSDYFLEISKLRAIQIIAMNVMKNYGWELQISLWGANSVMAYSNVDVDINILRATTACMSGIIGGCERVIIHPHDSGKKGKSFAARIAKNLQLMMKHEAHLDKVRDVAAGSYYIESLTSELASKAWHRFKQIEAAGGFTECFMKGEIQKEIGETAELRKKRFREKEDVVVGINKYNKQDDRPNRNAESSHTAGKYKSLVALKLEETI